MPRRLQQIPAQKAPEGAKAVGAASRWANPYERRLMSTKEKAVALRKFRKWVADPKRAGLVEEARRELRGRDLLCFCPIGQPCHADVWLELANAPEPVNIDA